MFLIVKAWITLLLSIYALFMLFLGLDCITKRLWLMDATLANIQCAKVVDWRKGKEDRLERAIGSHALIPLQVWK